MDYATRFALAKKFYELHPLKQPIEIIVLYEYDMGCGRIRLCKYIFE